MQAMSEAQLAQDTAWPGASPDLRLDSRIASFCCTSQDSRSTFWQRGLVMLAVWLSVVGGEVPERTPFAFTVLAAVLPPEEEAQNPGQSPSLPLGAGMMCRWRAHPTSARTPRTEPDFGRVPSPVQQWEQEVARSIAFAGSSRSRSYKDSQASSG